VTISIALMLSQSECYTLGAHRTRSGLRNWWNVAGNFGYDVSV